MTAPAVNAELAAALERVAQLQAAAATNNPAAVVPPPVIAPPPVAPTPPRPWAYGDALNAAQDMLASQGKPLFVVAMAADEGRRPTMETALAWPGATAPFVAYPATMTPVGVPESGRVNPPEAPAVAAANPEQAQRLHEAAQAAAGGPPPVVAPVVPPAVPEGDPGDDKALRTRLKDEAVKLGLVDKGDRRGVKAFQELLAAHYNNAPKVGAPIVDQKDGPALDMKALADALAPLVAERLAARLLGAA